MIIRAVFIKDYEKIKTLFKRNNMKIISYERWKNLWQKNPILKNKKKKWIKGWVIEKNKRIVGHIGQFPMQYFLNEKPYLCSVLYGWVVDWQFRSHSIILLKKYFTQQNIDFYFGTALNEKANKIMRMMNIKDVPAESLNYSLTIVLNLKKIINYLFKNFSFPLKKYFLTFFSYILSLILRGRFSYWKNKFSNENIIKCKKIDEKFNTLWRKIKKSQKNTLLLQRDQKWMRWHLGYFISNKKAWILLSTKKNKINGYSICIEKNNLKTGIKSTLLIDLMTFDKSETTSINLIGSSIEESKRRNCDIFEFRGFNEEKILHMKLFKPFKKKLINNPFCYKSDNKKLNKLLGQSKYWCPSYLDGDAIVDL